MWFKNLAVYQFVGAPPADDSSIEHQLSGKVFEKCSSQQESSLGWVPPLGDQSQNLVHGGGGFSLLTLKKQQRLLPPSVVQEILAEKVADIETSQDRKVGRKQKLELKEEIIFDLMPRAFTRSTRTSGVIMREQGLLIVDATSWNKADEWTHFLRDTLGTLKIRPVNVNGSTTNHFTGWISGEMPIPNHLVLGDQCELRSMEEQGAIIRIKHQELFDPEVQNHIKAGKSAVKLGLTWNDLLTFFVTDTLEIKRLKFSDVIQERAADEGAENQAALFDASFTLMCLELAKFLSDLFKSLGGLAEAGPEA